MLLLELADLKCTAVATEIVEPILDLCCPLWVGRTVQVGQVDIAHLGDRPLIRRRRRRSLQFISDLDTSKGRTSGILILFAANPLDLLIEQWHAFLGARLGVVPAVR